MFKAFDREIADFDRNVRDFDRNVKRFKPKFRDFKQNILVAILTEIFLILPKFQRFIQEFSRV